VKNIHRIAVYCGASAGNSTEYRKIAEETGMLMANAGYELVYGGGKVGMMGIVADAMLQAGAKVTGVIPHFLFNMEVGHEGVTELIKVETMHERKMKMYEIADAFLALPGGFGTMEELFEMLTWAQLGLHTKPICVLNCLGFYDGLQEQANRMERSGFLHSDTKSLLHFAQSPNEAITYLSESQLPEQREILTIRNT
jgi:uncharacterized protein (TIGR00730 family)